MAEVKNNEKREANDKLGPISAVLSIVSDVIGIAMLPDNVIWLRYIILGLSIVLLLCLFRLLLGGHWRENMFETSLILVTLIFSLAFNSWNDCADIGNSAFLLFGFLHPR